MQSLTQAPPVVWSIAGNDSGGGAGLSADQRAADAFGVHLCPVVAAVTAQHSRAVTRIEPVSVDLLDAQLRALNDDMRPRAVKTGLLGSVGLIRCVAAWIDRLRDEQASLALVVDPVLASSSGAAFADADAVAAYRDELLPRATLVTPNRREAALLAGGADRRHKEPDADALPALAAAFRSAGAGSICITGGDAADALALDWLSSEHAEGWLALPRVNTAHAHGTGCTFASSAAAALALGFVAADAVVLAKMATAHALRHARAAGSGAGPVVARAGFAADPSLLPVLSFGASAPSWPAPPRRTDDLGLYAIVDSAERAGGVLAAGIRTVQLRIKDAPDAGALRDEVVQCLAACREAGARLLVNDHWRLALELGSCGVHLGQEDLGALAAEEREALVAGAPLGVSSHSLWELTRAKGLGPAYVACGPVWPTLTKAMPWRPQGLDNLAWWCSIAAPLPVVAIGGIVSADRVEAAASCGAAGVCLVRALGDDPSASVPPLRQALRKGRSAVPVRAPDLPHPSLDRL